jgi:UDP-glucose 4-epimerase
MKVLVTGGAGFIGSHVCDALLGKGHAVVALDDLSTGQKQNVPKGARLVVLDIRSAEAAQLIAGEKFDAVVHLAAQMDVRKSVDSPAFDADVNVVGTLNLLEAARKAGVKKVVFSSTGGAVYGEQDVFPATEAHPHRPVSPYGCSKAACELYLNYYRVQYGLAFVALRYANVYGPRQSPHGEAGVVAIFSQKLLRGASCTIYGDGGQTRDFVYVGDVARANLLALESSQSGEAFNIGTGVETDVNALYRHLAEAAGSTTPAVHAAGKPGEQRRSVIDPGKAGRVLGWKPEVALAQGLRQTLEWFRQAT